MEFKSDYKNEVDELLAIYQKSLFPDSRSPLYLPQKKQVKKIISMLQCILFPGYFDEKSSFFIESPGYLLYLLHETELKLTKEIENALISRLLYGENGLYNQEDLQNSAKELCSEFLRTLPFILEMLLTDVEAAFIGDPAAENREQIITSYPGFFAITVQRLAHELFLLNIPMIPRIMTELAHETTGIDIHPGATIGTHFFIDHGTGVVIGETTNIGNYAKIYQGVTLGALSTSGGQNLKGVKRHPTLLDRVTVYAGATVLGGDTVIGNDVTLGGNVFITKSIPENQTILPKPLELIIMEK